jgi:hypothetical protein
MSFVAITIIVLLSFTLAAGFTYFVKYLSCCKMNGCCLIMSLIAILCSPIIFNVGDKLLDHAGFLISLIAITAGMLYVIFFIEVNETSF